MSPRAGLPIGLLLASVVAVLAVPAGAATATAPAPCSTKELSLFLQAHSGSGGTVIEAGFNHFKGSACRLTLGYTLSIQTEAASSTRVHSIVGNPSSVKKSLILRPKQRVTFRWLWRNWCGAVAQYRLNALDSARGGLIVKSPPPPCTASGSRSTLAPIA
jgi:hypothetical protein